jgi:hypothetical protein
MQGWRRGMQAAGAGGIAVRDIKVCRGQAAVDRARIQRGAHDRGAVRAVTQAQSVSQLVRHHSLEIVLGRANLCGITAGVKIPADRPEGKDKNY